MEHTKGKLELSSHCTGLAQIGGITRFAVFPNMCNTPMQLARRNANAKELVRRWNAFEKDGLVDELKRACELGLTKALGISIAATELGAPITPTHQKHIEIIQAAIAKVS